jgi:hypothetical protein
VIFSCQALHVNYLVESICWNAGTDNSPFIDICYFIAHMVKLQRSASNTHNTTTLFRFVTSRR